MTHSLSFVMMSLDMADSFSDWLNRPCWRQWDQNNCIGLVADQGGGQRLSVDVKNKNKQKKSQTYVVMLIPIKVVDSGEGDEHA